MLDPAHLDELIAQQTDDLSIRLLSTFARMSRDTTVNVNDYPPRLRQAMDSMFQEASNAPTDPHSA